MSFDYIDPNTEKGFLRARRGKSFMYLDHRGQPLRAQTHVERIKKLVIPPAWEEVWICKNHRGHIQVVGLDPKGRKQYIYHQNWLAHRGEQKFRSLISFASKLPQLRQKLKKHLSQKELSRERVLAACVTILDSQHLRVGNESYAKENQTYGLSTVRKKHVNILKDGAFFNYKGKKGIQREVMISDKALVNLIKECQDLPGYDLFKYKDNSRVVDVKSEDINNYIREHMGLEDVSAKTFRTWWGCVYMLESLSKGDSEGIPEKKAVIEAYKNTAKRLANTVAVCKSSYVDPNIIKSFQDKELWKKLCQKKQKRGLSPHECQLGHVLRCYYG